MRIVAATPLYPPASRVGAWLTTHEFLAAAVAAGHDVEVVTSLAAASFGRYVLDGVGVQPGGNLGDAISSADVVVSHLGDDQKASRLARSLGVPSVRMVHGIPAPAHVLDDDLAVFNSASLATAVGWAGDSIVCHPPVDVAQYRTTPGRYVSLVNLSADKGGDLFWRLAKAMPDVQFLGVRGGYGMQLSDKGKNVTVVAPTLDMAGDVYSRTRILLMPSVHETWGRTGIEAACSGIPTIAAPTPGLVESLGDAGTFVDRNDFDGWVAAIRHLMGDGAWAAASARAAARAAELDPAPDLARFVAAIESLVPAKVAA